MGTFKFTAFRFDIEDFRLPHWANQYARQLEP